jgi:MFS family permease
MGAVENSLWSWWGHWALVSIGETVTAVVVWTAGISLHFTTARGKAMAIMLCGSGAAATIFPILANEFIEAIGWRLTYVSMGVAAAGVSLPLLLFLLPDTGSPSDLEVPEPRQDESAAPVRDAPFSRHFIFRAVVAFIVNIAVLEQR